MLESMLIISGIVCWVLITAMFLCTEKIVKAIDKNTNAVMANTKLTWNLSKNPDYVLEYEARETERRRMFETDETED